MKEIILKEKYKYQLYPIVIEKNENPKDFFDFCLEHNLYKDDGGIAFTSRMKIIYENVLHPFQGVSAIVAMKNNKPVGICMLEHRPGEHENEPMLITQAGMLHQDNRQRKDPWKKKYDWHYLHAGFISFFVKNSQRQRGLASHMLKEMQDLQLARLHKYNSFLSHEEKELIKNSSLIVTCRELAKHLVSSSKLFTGVHCDNVDYNFKKDISSLTYNVIFNEVVRKKVNDFIPPSLEQMQANEFLNVLQDIVPSKQKKKKASIIIRGSSINKNKLGVLAQDAFKADTSAQSLVQHKSSRFNI